MPAKRSNLSIRPSVYNKIRDYCAANDLVVGRWVEQALNNALDEATSPTRRSVPVPKRPPPVERNEPGDELPAWQRPPFWERS